MPHGENVVKAVKQFMTNRNRRTETGERCIEPICVAVSGGVDSMVLLHVLCSLHGQDRGAITVLHVHHHARAQADADAALVRTFCHRLCVSSRVLHVHREQVPASKRRGVEADLRELRYQALATAATEAEVKAVYLAHHADDQLETVMWRLLRGTGGTGVAGMRPQTTRLGLTWLRPLLAIEKEDLYAYARLHQVPYAEDESNASLDFTRNMLRQQVVPALKRVEPKAAERVAAFSRIAQEEDAWLHQEARDLLALTAEIEPQRACIHLAPFLEAARPLQRRMIQILLYCLESGPISFAHVEQVLHAAASDTPSSEFLLYPTLLVRREYELLWLEHQGKPTGGGEAPYEETWHLRNTPVKELLRTPPAWSWRFTCDPWHRDSGVKSQSLFEVYIPERDELVLKSVHAGDRILLPSGGHKKLQDALVDAKVPRRLRTQWPIVWLDNELLWVPGVRRSAAQLMATDALHGLVLRAYPFMVRDAKAPESG